MYGADTESKKKYTCDTKEKCNATIICLDSFIHSTFVREKKIHNQKFTNAIFFLGRRGELLILQSFWVLRVFTYLFCNIGRFVGLPFLSNLEVFCIFKISHFQKLLLAFFVNSLRKSIGGFDHRLTIWERKLRKEIWMIFKKNFQKMPHKK